MRSAGVVVFLTAGLLGITGAEAGEEAPRIQATRTSVAPVLDGKLDDAVWATAPASGGFAQRFPRESEAASESTAFRVLYDDRALYIGLRMEDADASRIVSQLTVRDRVVESDWVSVEIDSRHDHATAAVFQVNAAGVELDGMVYNDTERTTEWDGIRHSAVAKDEAGWTAEIEIPPSILRFSDAEVQEWGLQVTRYISRKKETDQWRLIPSVDSGYVSRFGHLEGFGVLRPRRTFELRPYASVRAEGQTDSGFSFLNVPSGEPPALGVEAGLDMKLGLTADLTLDLALNPDFGLVEADEVVGGIYDDLTIGTMAAMTGGEGELDVTSDRVFVVGRGRYAIGDASYIGAMTTATARVAGETADAYDNHDEYVVFQVGGAYSDFVEIRTDGVQPRIRFADLMPSTGQIDESFRDNVLNVNMAGHWQIRPGTRLSLLYSREQEGSPADDEGRYLPVRGLFRGRTEDVLLMKLVYFLDGLGG